MANLREEIDTLLEPYQPAIRKILAGFELRRLRCIDEDEVRAAAVMGVKEAERNYDPARGATRATHAYRYIEAELRAAAAHAVDSLERLEKEQGMLPAEEESQETDEMWAALAAVRLKRWRERIPEMSAEDLEDLLALWEDAPDWAIEDMGQRVYEIVRGYATANLTKRQDAAGELVDISVPVHMLTREAIREALRLEAIREGRPVPPPIANREHARRASVRDSKIKTWKRRIRQEGVTAHDWEPAQLIRILKDRRTR